MTDKPDFVQWDDAKTGERRCGELDQVRSMIRIVSCEEVGADARKIPMDIGTYTVPGQAPKHK